MKKQDIKVDRSAFSVTTLEDQDKLDDQYWRDKTPHERLEAVELTRQILYGYDPSTVRLQRVLEIGTRM